MKKIAIAALVVVLLLAALGAFAVRNLNSYLADNREWIEDQVEASLGRPVSIGGLGASLGWGIRAVVRELRVDDDPAYSKDAFLQAGEASVRVKLLPLLSGRVEVGRVAIHSPQIQVIQGPRGMNIDSIAAADTAPAAPTESDAEPTDASALSLALLRIDDARLLYRDTRPGAESEIEIGGLDFDFQSEGSLEAFRGRLEVNADTLRMRADGTEDDSWEPLRFAADLARDGESLDIDDATLRAADLRVDFDARVGNLSGEPSLDAEFNAPSGEISGIPFDGLAGALRYAESRATVEDVVLEIFGGTVNLRGSYDMRDPARPSFHIDTDVSGVRVEQAIATQSPAAAEQFRGELVTTLELAGSGDDWEAIRPGLRGTGTMKLVEGVLSEVNLGESALGSLSSVPGLQDLLGGGLRARYPALFGGDETRFDQVEAGLKIGGGVALVERLILAARDFTVRGTGQVDLDGALRLPTRFVCSEALGNDLIEREERLSALVGDEGRLEFPLMIRGTLPEVRAEPDLKEIASVLGRREVGDLLSRALSGSESSEGAPEGEASGDRGESGSEPGESDAEKLLNKGLDSLFGR